MCTGLVTAGKRERSPLLGSLPTREVRSPQAHKVSTELPLEKGTQKNLAESSSSEDRSHKMDLKRERGAVTRHSSRQFTGAHL